MKTIIYSVLLMVFCLPLTTNAQQTTEEQLIGTWIFNYDTSYNLLEVTSKQQLDSLPVEVITQLKSDYIGRKVTFSTDGTYAQVYPDGFVINATWHYDSTHNNVVITNPQGGISIQKITQLNSNELLLVPQMKANTKMILNQWYFTKL